MSTTRLQITIIGLIALIVCVMLAIEVSNLPTNHPAKLELTPETTHVKVNLQSFCEGVLKANESACTTWVKNILNNQLQGAKDCVGAFDWFAKSDNFGNCLWSKGVPLTTSQASAFD